MALAWKAGWVQALGGSNPPTSAIALKDTNVPGTIFSGAQSVRLLPLRFPKHTRNPTVPTILDLLVLVNSQLGMDLVL